MSHIAQFRVMEPLYCPLRTGIESQIIVLQFREFTQMLSKPKTNSQTRSHLECVSIRVWFEYSEYSNSFKLTKKYITCTMDDVWGDV